MISKNVIKICLILYMFSFISCGTLGGFNIIRFPVSKKKLEVGLDSLFVINTNYKYPIKWSNFDNWSERGYDFLEGRIIYFKKKPEEMYYISFIGEVETLNNNTYSEIAIRAIHNNSSLKWLKQEDFSKDEQKRIQARFKSEIITKLEKYTNSKAIDLGN